MSTGPWTSLFPEDRRAKAPSSSIKSGSPTAAPRAAKSTIINLLLRFYDVSRGRILIDGVDLRELPLADLRSLFSLVLQDVHLFSGTIAENIRLGAAIPDEAVRGAAVAVHADPFVT